MKSPGHLMELNQFDSADQIQIILTDPLDTDASPVIIAGRIVIPEKSLIDVHAVKNIDGIIREDVPINRIGLAANLVEHEDDGTPVYTTHQHSLATAAEFAYYFAEDMIPNANRELAAPEDKIQSTRLRVHSVSINGINVLNASLPANNSDT